MQLYILSRCVQFVVLIATRKGFSFYLIS
jgi:hypothetical protein